MVWSLVLLWVVQYGRPLRPFGRGGEDVEEVQLADRRAGTQKFTNYNNNKTKYAALYETIAHCKNNHVRGNYYVGAHGYGKHVWHESIHGRLVIGIVNCAGDTYNCLLGTVHHSVGSQPVRLYSSESTYSVLLTVLSYCSLISGCHCLLS